MKTRSRSALFLLELVIVILAFSLSAAICLRVFFQSRLISNESRDISHAALAVQTVADSYKAMNGDLDRTAELLDGTSDADSVSFYYNSVWEHITDLSAASFTVTIVRTGAEHRECSVTAADSDGNHIFSVIVRGGLDLA